VMMLLGRQNAIGEDYARTHELEQEESKSNCSKRPISPIPHMRKQPLR